MGVHGASTTLDGFSSRIWEHQEEEGFLLESKLMVTSSMFTESKSIRTYFAKFQTIMDMIGLKTKRFQLDGRVGLLDLLGRNTFSGQMGSSS